jgi:hypothetical protein
MVGASDPMLLKRDLLLNLTTEGYLVGVGHISTIGCGYGTGERTDNPR